MRSKLNIRAYSVFTWGIILKNLISYSISKLKILITRHLFSISIHYRFYGTFKVFNPYPLIPDKLIFGTVTERNFWKRSKNIACDVTVGTKNIKLYVHVKCRLGYVMMLILNGICQIEGKYADMNKNICHFREPSVTVHHRARFPEKNPKLTNIQIDAMLRSGFSRKTRSVKVPHFSRIQG